MIEKPKPNESEIVYAVFKKDGTRYEVKGNFLKYDSGNVMIIRNVDTRSVMVAVVNMEAVTLIVDAEAIPPAPPVLNAATVPEYESKA